MSATDTDLASAARRILTDAGRPLSVRRIQRLWPEPAPDLEQLRATLEAEAGNGGGLTEVRRGIYAIGDQPRRRAPNPPPDEPARRRRRRARPSDMVSDDPATSLTVTDAVARAESATDREALRRSLWEKMRASAAAIIAEDPPSEPPPSADPVPPAPAELSHRETELAAEPDPATPVADLKAAMRERLQARRNETRPLRTSAPAPAAPPEPAELPDPVGGRRPYVERRAAEPAAPAEPERREPELPELSPTNALVASAMGILRETGAPVPTDELTERVGDQGLSTSGLRAAVLAENARRTASGLRAPFVVRYSGAIGLSEWGLSARYRTLEASIQASMAEQREIVRRDLLARIGELTDGAFEQVVVMLLEQLGYENVSIVHRQRGGNLALSVRRDEGAGPESTAVVARRSWSSMKPDTVRALRDSLDHFGATRGLIVSMGTFTRAARREASLGDRPVVRLVDGAGLARLLYEHGVGLASHQPLMRYVDVAFFESLE